MPQHGHVARPIDWIGSFSFLRMLREMRSAANLTRVLLGFVCVLACMFAGRMLDAAWGSAGVIPGTLAEQVILDAAGRGATRVSSELLHMQTTDRAGASAGAVANAGPFTSLLHYEAGCASAAIRGVLAGRFGWSSSGGSDPALLSSVAVASSGVIWIIANRPVYAIVYGILHLLIVGLFGTAICRHTAIQSARGISLGYWEVLGYAWERRGKVALLGLGPIGALLLLAGGLMLGWLLLGLVARVPATGATPIVLLAIAATVFFIVGRAREAVGGLYLPVFVITGTIAVSVLIGYLTGFSLVAFLGYALAGLLYVVALLGGAFMALLLTAIVLALPLSRAAMAAKGGDVLDAAQSGASYVIQRPWKFTFYAILWMVYAALALSVARAAVLLTFKLAHDASGAGFSAWGNWSGAKSSAGALDALWTMPAWGEISLLPGGGAALWGTFATGPLSAAEATALWFIGLWVTLVVGVLAGYGVSLFYTGATQIHFLLRREVDGDDYEDVHFAEEEDAFGFEPLSGAAPTVVPVAGRSGTGVAAGVAAGGETGKGISLPVMK